MGDLIRMLIPLALDDEEPPVEISVVGQKVDHGGSLRTGLLDLLVNPGERVGRIQRIREEREDDDDERNAVGSTQTLHRLQGTFRCPESRRAFLVQSEMVLDPSAVFEGRMQPGSHKGQQSGSFPPRWIVNRRLRFRPFEGPAPLGGVHVLRIVEDVPQHHQVRRILEGLVLENGRFLFGVDSRYGHDDSLPRLGSRRREGSLRALGIGVIEEYARAECKRVADKDGTVDARRLGDPVFDIAVAGGVPGLRRTVAAHRGVAPLRWPRVEGQSRDPFERHKRGAYSKDQEHCVAQIPPRAAAGSSPLEIVALGVDPGWFRTHARERKGHACAGVETERADLGETPMSGFTRDVRRGQYPRRTLNVCSPILNTSNDLPRASVVTVMPVPGARPLDRYHPALDGLRAVATLAVFLSHFFPERSLVHRAFHWGRFGVMLFFVLSGFLITGLLLRGRDEVDGGRSTWPAVFRAFVARRALRIAPIYYLVILLGWWVGYGPIANLLPFHLTYTGNIALTYFHKPLAQATHLWSLCVEEQFYLLWPFVILLAPAKRLLLISLGLVAFSFAYEVVGTLNGRSFEQTHLVLQGCMDALGLGAVLAIFVHRDAGSGRLAARLSYWCCVFGAPLFFFAQGFRYQVGIPATDRIEYRLPSDLGLALLSTAAVYLATTTGPSIVRRALEVAPLRFLGRISYGMYLYHLFLIPIGRAAARRYEWPELARGWTMFFVYGAITIILATISWYLIEAPINAQKRRFPYPPAAALKPPSA